MSQTIAANLRRFRESKGLSQLKLAQRMGLKNHSSIGHWEGGQTPDAETVQKIASALGLTPQDIDPRGEAFTIAKRRKRGPGKRALQKSRPPADSGTVSPATPPEAGVRMDPGDLFEVPDADLFRKVLGVWLSLDSHEERAALLGHVRAFTPHARSARAKNDRR